MTDAEKTGRIVALTNLLASLHGKNSNSQLQTLIIETLKELVKT